MVPRPIGRINARRDRALFPSRERGRRGDAREAVRDQEGRASREGEMSPRPAEASQIEESEESHRREDPERDEQVLQMPVGNDYARRDRDADERGEQEDRKPDGGMETVFFEVEESPARRGAGKEDDERDEIREALGRNVDGRPGDPPQDREHSDGEQGDCRGDPRCGDRLESRSSRSVPPGDSTAESDERRQEEESEAEADEQQPPRSDVDVGQDRLAERGRIAEPIGEGPDDEDRREGDLAHPAGAGRPRTHQASDGDRPEDRQQEEIGREVVRDDQSARDQEQWCEGFRVRAEPEEQDQTREHEQVPGGGGGRVGRRVRMGDGPRQERGREESETRLLRDADREEEHRDDGEGSQDGDEKVQDRGDVSTGQVQHSRLRKENAGKVGVRDPPSVVYGGNVAGAKEALKDREIFAGVGSPVEEGPERREANRGRGKQDRREGRRDGFPHSPANRPALIKRYRDAAPGSTSRGVANYFPASLLSNL